MKKLLFGICFIVAFVLAGCASNQMAYVFDPGIPEDQMSFLFVPTYIKVKQFGGKTVEWIAPPMSLAPIKVGVPSGEFTLIIDTVISSKAVASRLNDVRDKPFTKYFEAGKGYQLIGGAEGEIELIDLK